MTPYIIRNYQPADFDSYVRLCQEAEKLAPYPKPVSPQAIAERISRPSYSPEQDLFVVEAAGSIVGHINLIPELGIGRVILTCWLHPEHRRKGLATKLLGQARHRARELGARVAHVNITEDNTVAKIVLSRLGFKLVRRFLELELDMAGPSRQETNQPAQGCRHLSPGEEDKLTRIQNLSFAEHWGYNPNTVATTTHRMNLSQCSPDDIFLACEGDEITGFCWTETTPREGRIFMLGVAPYCRRQGTGRRLLRAGLDYLKSKGQQVAVLTVDSENKEARALYHLVGFYQKSSSLWYGKAINQDTGDS